MVTVNVIAVGTSPPPDVNDTDTKYWRWRLLPRVITNEIKITISNMPFLNDNAFFKFIYLFSSS